MVGDRHHALQQRAEGGLLAVGERLLLGGNRVGSARIDRIVADGVDLVVGSGAERTRQRRQQGSCGEDGSKCSQHWARHACFLPAPHLSLGSESPRAAYDLPDLPRTRRSC